ncbi:MAG: helix-turn-helix transcriptional regulator [Desulfitobacterium hafniense]|nr:helix-turn-helix transcriptional regulator [Desulfitobacterium hafniense]
MLKAIAITIRDERLALGMSQEHLADNSALDRTYISGVERLARNVSVKSLEKIIKGLGLTNKEFLSKLLNNIEEAE